MWNRSKLNVRQQPIFWLIMAVILVATAFAGRILAQESSMQDRIYVITHVDTLPSNGPALKFLEQYAADSRKDKGAIRIELLDQISKANHFAFVEVWENQQAYDAHLAAAHTRQFREQVQPLLGSPFDERPHHIVE